MLSLKIVPKDSATLRAQSRPGSAQGMDVNPYVLYDTQQYISAATTRLNYFQNVNADTTLSNMETAGVLPAETFFELHRIFINVLNRPTVNAAATALGQADDLSLLYNTGRGTLTFTMSSKTLGPIPLHFFGPVGAVNGALAATLTAPAVVQHGWIQNDGGFPVNGSIIIAPQSKFAFSLDWAAAQTLAGGNTYIRLSLFGVLSRRIV